MTIPYSEPTNEQLAAFMAVYARRMPAFSHLAISPALLEHIFETRPEYRKVALHHHRKFQNNVNQLQARLLQGLLPCEHILLSGKQCPNHNVPGSHFCGLHQPDEETVE